MLWVERVMMMLDARFDLDSLRSEYSNQAVVVMPGRFGAGSTSLAPLYPAFL
jgi:hypothetical protein